MELFTVLDEPTAIIRIGKGCVEKQVKLYRRGHKLYVPHSGGYVEVRKRLENGSYNTAHPLVKLLEFCDLSCYHEETLGQQILRYKS